MADWIPAAVYPGEGRVRDDEQETAELQEGDLNDPTNVNK
jgi:hypothetical protein